MLKASSTGMAKGGRRNFYSRDSDLSNTRAMLLKVQALDDRRTKLRSEIGTINEQISTLRTKIAEDLAVFRQ
jgi:hypothetical protein